MSGPLWKNTSFDSIIPGLETGRYDVGIAGFNTERDRLKVVDFVGYYLSGGGFLVQKGSGIEVNHFNDTICGHRVAVLKAARQSRGKMCVTGTYRTTHSITGIAVPKRLSSLDKALQQGIQRLIDSGRCQQIARKWGIGVKGASNEVAPDFARISMQWGVAADGSIEKSTILTTPSQIDVGDDTFPQPIRGGCA